MAAVDEILLRDGQSAREACNRVSAWFRQAARGTSGRPWSPMSRSSAFVVGSGPGANEERGQR